MADDPSALYLKLVPDSCVSVRKTPKKLILETWRWQFRLRQRRGGCNVVDGRQKKTNE